MYKKRSEENKNEHRDYQTYKNVQDLIYSEQAFSGKWYYIQKISKSRSNSHLQQQERVFKNRKILKNYWKLVGTYQGNKVDIVYGDLSRAAARTGVLK